MIRRRFAASAAAAAACFITLTVTAWRSAPEPVPTGAVRGTVSLDGAVRYTATPPEPTPIDMSSDAFCAAAHTTPVSQSPVVVGAQGGLRNAVVFVQEGLAPARHVVPQEPVVLDQRGCIYEPHVVALRAGQTLLIRNSDATLHNVHVTARTNRGFNIGQPIRGIESRRVLDRAEIGITVACDIHRWMGGAIAVFDHPYFAVTDDHGAFSLDGLPPGEYVIQVWHETLGTRSQRVTVTAGGQATTTFSFPGN